MDNPATSVKPQSAGGTPSNVKTVDLTSVLRAPPSEQPNIIRNRPLTLSNPVMVAQHTPCTLHYSILPPELACELFYTMLDAAQGWSRNKWWLFDRLVESPHRTSFFARIEGTDMGKDNEETWKEEAQFWYNGRRTDPPHPFPEEMEAACRYVEKVVNQEISKRIRFPLEWGGPSDPDGQTWRANVAAANCYEGTREGVGFHSDQLTNLGPYPTIASISLGTTRLFRLREVIPSSEADKRQARTYNIPLPHNSLIIMHASTQERFKHCESRARTAASISLSGSIARTFTSSTTPRCKCGVPCILRPDMKSRVDRREANIRDQDLRKSGKVLVGIKGKEKERISAGFPSKGSEGNDDRGYHIKYWWTCYAGAQNEGRDVGCGG
ncbi:hypothetical protein DFH11DRAFT_1824010 [Phellopilus nigrolimitatus]|nr:hypothetical protein DFH11DRAFT_1824010 [Phellopilus nigrolimitatus]